MRSAAIGAGDMGFLRRLYELLSWYDPKVDAAKAVQVEQAVKHAQASATAADSAIRDRRQDDLRASFGRADARLRQR